MYTCGRKASMFAGRGEYAGSEVTFKAAVGLLSRDIEVPSPGDILKSVSTPVVAYVPRNLNHSPLAGSPLRVLLRTFSGALLRQWPTGGSNEEPAP